MLERRREETVRSKRQTLSSWGTLNLTSTCITPTPVPEASNSSRPPVGTCTRTQLAGGRAGWMVGCLLYTHTEIHLLQCLVLIIRKPVRVLARVVGFVCVYSFVTVCQSVS